MIIITPKSSATALVLVEMAVEDTMEEEQMGMRTKKIWRKTILEPDDESGAKQSAFIGFKTKDKKANLYSLS